MHAILYTTDKQTLADFDAHPVITNLDHCDEYHTLLTALEQATLSSMVLLQTVHTSLLTRCREVVPTLPLILLLRGIQQQSLHEVLTNGNSSDHSLLRHVDAVLSLPCSESTLTLHLKQLQLQQTTPLHAGPFQIRTTVPEIIHHNGAIITLTPTEHRILVALLRHRPHIVPARQLCNVIGHNSLNGIDSIRVHISGIRKKLDYAYDIDLIKTIPGLGYTIVLQ